MKSNKFRTVLIILLMLNILFSAMLSGCANTNVSKDITGFYFNTVVHFTFYGNDADKYGTECLNICNKYEQMLSRTISNSDIYKINHSNGQPTIVSDDTAYLLNQAIHYSELTHGRIDVTIAPLMDLWKFTDPLTNTPPSDVDIQKALQHVDYKNLIIDGNSVILSDSEASVDLGFLAKGYVADQIKKYLVSCGVESAIINLGGNVLTIGVKPDGDAFCVGIQTPFDTGGTSIKTLSIKDSSVVTSGIYERFFEYNGTIYHHILDAKTGYPIQNNINSVTILSDSSMEGDALSTTCLILGVSEGKQLLDSLSSAEGIFIDSNNQIK